MALSPLRPPEQRIEVTDETQPNRDWYLDIETGELRNRKVERKQAIKQFIRKALKTARYRYLIYSDEYGCELEDAIGSVASDNLIYTEIPRFIREALIYDDRISDVTNFRIFRHPKYLRVEFTVRTVEGLINEEVTI